MVSKFPTTADASTAITYPSHVLRAAWEFTSWKRWCVNEAMVEETAALNAELPGWGRGCRL